MVDYQKLYFHLFGKVSNTVAAIDLMRAAGSANGPDQVIQMAREGLVQALLETEEMYLAQGEDR